MKKAFHSLGLVRTTKKCQVKVFIPYANENAYFENSSIKWVTDLSHKTAEKGELMCMVILETGLISTIIRNWYHHSLSFFNWIERTSKHQKMESNLKILQFWKNCENNKNFKSLFVLYNFWQNNEFCLNIDDQQNVHNKKINHRYLSPCWKIIEEK